jgi:hypothetical protein
VVLLFVCFGWIDGIVGKIKHALLPDSVIFGACAFWIRPAGRGPGGETDFVRASLGYQLFFVSFQIDPDRPDDGNDQARVRVCRKLWIANGFFFSHRKWMKYQTCSFVD